MQEDDDGTIGGPGFGITDIEDAGLDLFQRGKRGVGARPDRARAGFASPDCAKRAPLVANGAAASATAAVPRKRRRSGLVGWDMDLTPALYLIRLDRMRYK